jgi:hypothetical protein
MCCFVRVERLWTDDQNFMKCLMKMHAKDNKGVLFYETICSFKQQRHTYIEAVPMPFEHFQDAPAYFRVCYHPPSIPLSFYRS